MADVARVLKPGGCFLASDWLIATDQPSEAMGAWMAAEGLEFSMATARDYRQALDSAGFEDIRITSRNAWYRSEARREREPLLTTVQTLRLSAAEREYLRHETGFPRCSPCD